MKNKQDKDEYRSEFSYSLTPDFGFIPSSRPHDSRAFRSNVKNGDETRSKLEKL